MKTVLDSVLMRLADYQALMPFDIPQSLIEELDGKGYVERFILSVDLQRALLNSYTDLEHLQMKKEYKDCAQIVLITDIVDKRCCVHEYTVQGRESVIDSEDSLKRVLEVWDDNYLFSSAKERYGI